MCAAGLSAALLAGCGAERAPEGVGMTGTPQGSSASPSPSASEPPLSQIPPPTMTQPVPPPKNPSDRFAPVTMTGTAKKDTATGCILFTLDMGGVVELVGPMADSALGHPRVTVVAVARPNYTSPCELSAMQVQSVATT